MCPVDIASCPVNPGQAYNDPSGPIVCACSLCTWHGPLCTPSCVLKPWRLVCSRRDAILSPIKSQLLQDDPLPAPAEVMHEPFRCVFALPTGMSGIMPF